MTSSGQWATEYSPQEGERPPRKAEHTTPSNHQCVLQNKPGQRSKEMNEL